MVDAWLLAPFFLLGAALYTSVGHGGATIYLAILALSQYPRAGALTTVLALNVLAAGVAFAQFQRAGHLRTRILWPFVVTSVPAAYLGGLVPFGSVATDLLLAVALTLAAFRFLLLPTPTQALRSVPPGAFLWIAPALGLVLGFLAGTVGIGGGIFLSPILVLLGWATLKEAASIASAFIVLNSLAGLGAKLPTQGFDYGLLGPALVAVAIGATIGGALGARRIPPRALQALLGIVLLVAVARILYDLWPSGPIGLI